MNIIEQVTGAWKAFCRPPRQNYSVFDLGSPVFQIKGIRCKRHDFKVQNSRSHLLECSFYEPLGIGSMDCVIYLHCFNGSRIESVKFAEPVIAKGCAFCCFDFSGSGLSQGDYVSLGYYEQDDVAAVVEYLKTNMGVSSIGLWGRSMGGVTALLYTQKFPSEIRGLAIDSAFVSMYEAALEIADKKVSLPTIFIKGMLEYVRRQIKSNAGYDMDDVNTLKNIAKCSMPVLFIVSKEDKLVPHTNSMKLYEKYPESARKSILFVKGNHNECRDWENILEIVDFLVDSIKTADSGNTIGQLRQDNLQGQYGQQDNQQQQQQYQFFQQQQGTYRNQDNKDFIQQQTNRSNNNNNKGFASSQDDKLQERQNTATSDSNNNLASHFQLRKPSPTQNPSTIFQFGRNPNNPNTNSSSSLSQNINTNNIQQQQQQQQQQPYQINSQRPTHKNSFSQLGGISQTEQPIIINHHNNNKSIDSKEFEENPLVQSLLKDLIQKQYSNINQNHSSSSPIKQQQSYDIQKEEEQQQKVLEILKQQQQQQSQYQSNSGDNNIQNYQSANGNQSDQFVQQQQLVLSYGVVGLQQSLQIQPSSLEEQQQLKQIYEQQFNDQGLVTSTVFSIGQSQDMHVSNIPDEKHEIDFPRLKDFRTKHQINQINNHNFVEQQQQYQNNNSSPRSQYQYSPRIDQNIEHFSSNNNNIDHNNLPHDHGSFQNYLPSNLQGQNNNVQSTPSLKTKSPRYTNVPSAAIPSETIQDFVPEFNQNNHDMIIKQIQNNNNTNNNNIQTNNTTNVQNTGQIQVNQRVNVGLTRSSNSFIQNKGLLTEVSPSPRSDSYKSRDISTPLMPVLSSLHNTPSMYSQAGLFQHGSPRFFTENNKTKSQNQDSLSQQQQQRMEQQNLYQQNHPVPPTAVKNLSQIFAEESINHPQSNTYIHGNNNNNGPSNNQNHPLQSSRQNNNNRNNNGLDENQNEKEKQNGSLNNGNQIQDIDFSDTLTPTHSHNNINASFYDDEDFHNLPQNTMTVNLKQKKRFPQETSISSPVESQQTTAANIDYSNKLSRKITADSVVSIASQIQSAKKYQTAIGESKESQEKTESLPQFGIPGQINAAGDTKKESVFINLQFQEDPMERQRTKSELTPYIPDHQPQQGYKEQQQQQQYNQQIMYNNLERSKSEMNIEKPFKTPDLETTIRSPKNSIYQNESSHSPKPSNKPLKSQQSSQQSNNPDYETHVETKYFVSTAKTPQTLLLGYQNQAVGGISSAIGKENTKIDNIKKKEEQSGDMSSRSSTNNTKTTVAQAVLLNSSNNVNGSIISTGTQGASPRIGVQSNNLAYYKSSQNNSTKNSSYARMGEDNLKRLLQQQVSQNQQSILSKQQQQNQQMDTQNSKETNDIVNQISGQQQNGLKVAVRDININTKQSNLEMIRQGRIASSHVSSNTGFEFDKNGYVINERDNSVPLTNRNLSATAHSTTLQKQTIKVNLSNSNSNETNNNNNNQNINPTRYLPSSSTVTNGNTSPVMQNPMLFRNKPPIVPSHQNSSSSTKTSTTNNLGTPFSNDYPMVQQFSISPALTEGQDCHRIEQDATSNPISTLPVSLSSEYHRDMPQRQNRNIQEIMNSNNTSSSNCLKTYAPSPSSHTKHKILQKNMPFIQQSNLDSQRTSTAQFVGYNNPGFHSLTQEDYVRCKTQNEQQLQENNQAVRSYHQQSVSPTGAVTRSTGNSNYADDRFNYESAIPVSPKNSTSQVTSHKQIVSQNDKVTRKSSDETTGKVPTGNNPRNIQEVARSSISFGKNNKKDNEDQILQLKAPRASNQMSSQINGNIRYNNFNNNINMQGILAENTTSTRNLSNSIGRQINSQQGSSNTSSSSTSQKFAFKNRVHLATKVVQIQLGDQGAQMINDASSVISGVIAKSQQARSSKSPQQRLFQKQ